MARVSLVGLGHGGAQDYDTLIDWAAAESSIDYGGLPAEASCLGDCGGVVTIPAFSGGITPKIYTQSTTWDFTNEDDLAFCDGIDADNPVDVSDLMIEASNQFLVACQASSDNVSYTRVRIKHAGTSSPSVRVNGDYSNTIFANCVITEGSDTVFSGYQQGAIFNNCIATGASDKGFEASFGVGRQVLTDCFSYNNGGSDYDSGQLTTNTCASEDLTGDVTGYTGTELVDPANKDWRTKSTSDLATAGSGGSFIGVGLESGGGSPVTGDVAITISKPEFDSSGSATLPQPSGSIGFSVIKPSFDAVGEATLPNPIGSADFDISKPVFVSSGNATLPQPSGNIDLTIVKPGFSASGSATAPYPQGNIDLTIGKPLFLASGSSTQPNPSGNADFIVSEPEFSVNGSATLPNPSGSIGFDVSKPAFTASGSSTLPYPIGDIDLLIGKPLFSASGSVTLPKPDGDVDLTIIKPEFSIYGSVSGIELPIVNVLSVPVGSNTIKLPYTSNVIKI